MDYSKVAILCGTLLTVAMEASSKERESFSHWELFGDFVYLKRTDLHDMSIVKDSDDHTKIHTKDLIHSFDFEPGYRVGLFYSPNDKNSFEGNFLLVEDWKGRKKKQGDEDLSFPFTSSTYDLDFTDADRAKAEYSSGFWDAELNYWRHFGPHGQEFFRLSGIVGLRFFHWDERFSLAMTTPPDTSTYTIHTENRILGAQLGLDFQMHPTRKICLELLAKVGGFANSTEQRQFLGDDDNTVSVRDSEKQQWQPGIFTDVEAQFGLQCTSWMNLHIGYEVLYLTGLALAPEQISKQVDSSAGKKDYTHGNAIVHGLFAGLKLNF